MLPTPLLPELLLNERATGPTHYNISSNDTYSLSNGGMGSLKKRAKVPGFYLLAQSDSLVHIYRENFATLQDNSKLCFIFFSSFSFFIFLLHFLSSSSLFVFFLRLLLHLLSSVSFFITHRIVKTW